MVFLTRLRAIPTPTVWPLAGASTTTSELRTLRWSISRSPASLPTVSCWKPLTPDASRIACCRKSIWLSHWTWSIPRATWIISMPRRSSPKPRPSIRRSTTSSRFPTGRTCIRRQRGRGCFSAPLRRLRARPPREQPPRTRPQPKTSMTCSTVSRATKPRRRSISTFSATPRAAALAPA